MTQNLHHFAHTLFPWINHNPKGFRPSQAQSALLFLLHGKQKQEQSLQDFYHQISHLILVGNRQNWALSYAFCQKFSPDELKDVIANWQKGDVDIWQQQIIKNYEFLQSSASEAFTQKQTKAQPIMLGLAWDILQAYQLTAKAVKTKLISTAEGRSWAILLAAMATEYSPSPKAFMAALMRDIHWAYGAEQQDTSLLKQKIEKLFAQAGHKFWQKNWDYSSFIGVSLSGAIKQALLGASRNMAFADMPSFAPFELTDCLFAFLYGQNETSFALNLTSLLLHERAYFETESNHFNLAHIFWQAPEAEQTQSILKQWLKTTVNIDNEASLDDMHQMIMVYGQNKEMQNQLYWYYGLSAHHQKKVKDNIKNEQKEAVDKHISANLSHDLQRLKLLEQAQYGQKLSERCFALSDYLENILFWRNSFLAGYVSEDKFYKNIKDLAQLIGQYCQNWQELKQNIAFIYQFRFIGAKEDKNLKLAWLDICEQNPTSPMHHHQWFSHIQKQPEENTQILLKRSHILSNNPQQFEPSAQLWALNMAAPLITGRQGLLTADIASQAYASENAMFLRYNLNIATSHDLNDHLDWLQSEGRRDLLSSLITEYGQYDDDEIETEIQNLKYMAPEPMGDLKYRIHQLLMIKENIEGVSQCQFWALDIMRYSALVQRGVVANLMDEDTAWAHLSSAAIALQHRYNGWEDAFWDFFRAWIFDAALYPEHNAEIERRRSLIQAYLNPLSPQSFYLSKLKWYMNLGSPEIPLFRENGLTENSLALNKISTTLH